MVIAAAIAVRTAYLDVHPFWVDEAESSINALTILEHGYPTDSYLGQPIYENTLVEPWPESQEYEFRDISYAHNHLAIYHGWLPLYAIAGSFALQHIQPDKVDGLWKSKHDLSEQKRRTRAGRFPAVLFGAVFLLLAYLGGKVLYGRDAAWAALIVGSIHPWHVSLSRQARYYSAQVTLTTACCLLLWLLIRNCTWKRIFLASAAFILLFYTHILSFVIAIAAFAICVPLILYRDRRSCGKLVAFGAIVAAGTLPWVIMTGFYGHQSHIPGAWSLLKLPSDLVRYRPLSAANFVLGLLAVGLVLVVLLFKSRVPERLRAPALHIRPALLLLSIWAACGYAGFILFMPAVSFTTDRLKLSYWGPLFLLEAAICAMLARILAPRFSVWLCPALMLLICFGRGFWANGVGHNSGNAWETSTAILREVDSLHLNNSAKVFCAPNDQLILTFYSGLPIQDISPVRKSYLDSYRGDIVYIDTGTSVDTGILRPERIQEAALHDGLRLSPAEAEQWSQLLGTWDYRQEMMRALAPGNTLRADVLPQFARRLLVMQRCEVSTMFEAYGFELVTRGFGVTTWAAWRAVCKYRFVDPDAHRGVHANYAERLRGSKVIFIPQADAVLYYSPESRLGPM